MHLSDPSRAAIGEVQRAFGLRPSTLTGVLDRLESRGYLRRELNPESRRSLLVVLTPEGQVVADEYLDTNRRLVTTTVAEHNRSVTMRAPEVTYLAWLNCTALHLGPDPAALFRERGGIELSPGADFGPGGNGFVRLNFATSRSLLLEILDRFLAATAQAAHSIAEH